MNTFEDERNRQIVPRWLPLRAACSLIPDGVIDFSLFKRVITDDAFQAKLSSWRRHRTRAFALDLIASALMVGRFDDADVRAAAQLLANCDSDVQPSMLSAAERILSGNRVPDASPDLAAVMRRDAVASTIRQIKHSLKSRGPDPFLYSDLAFYYSMLSQNKAARRAMRIALTHADNNPTLLRSAARFFLHETKNADESLHLLRGSPATRSDPMLMSAEISISEAFGRKTRLKKRARQLITQRDHHPFLVSELAGTVGTFEMRESSTRRARRAFAMALECPTENSFAQAKWASRFITMPEVEGDNRRLDHAYEAAARDQFWSGSFLAALSSAEDWAAFQPFSARPAIFASYVAGVTLEDHERAIAASNQGLVASPKSFVLRNNLAFSLALSGQVDEARREIDLASANIGNEQERAIASATRGLLAFRTGAPMEGRLLYQIAIDYFDAARKDRLAALARIFHAREEKRAATRDYPVIQEKALRSAVQTKPFGVAALKEIADDDSPHST